MLSKILIVGCGYLGTLLGQQALERGAEVFAVRRQLVEIPTSFQAIGWDVIAGPLPEPAAKQLSHQNFDLVVYAVAAQAYTSEAYQAAYVTGVRNVLAELQRVNASWQQMAFISSTAVYAENAGGKVVDGSESADDHFSNQALLEGEQLVIQSGKKHWVARLSGIYGPGRTKRFEKIKQDLLRQRPVLQEDNRWMNNVHVSDAANALLFIYEQHLNLPQPAPNIVLISDSTPMQQNDWVQHYATQLGITLVTDWAFSFSSTRRLSNKQCCAQLLQQWGFQYQYPSLLSFLAESDDDIE